MQSESRGINGDEVHRRSDHVHADEVTEGESKSSSAVAAVDAMLSFTKARRSVGGLDLKALINEGRA